MIDVSTEREFTLAINAKSHRRNYTPPSWRVICTPRDLLVRVKQMEEDEGVKVTKVIDGETRKNVTKAQAVAWSTE
jgi:hypothetical protein